VSMPPCAVPTAGGGLTRPVLPRGSSRHAARLLLAASFPASTETASQQTSGEKPGVPVLTRVCIMCSRPASASLGNDWSRLSSLAWRFPAGRRDPHNLGPMSGGPE
jgi:hypothetical protein